MPERISWNVTAQVAGGPRVSVANTLDVEAYDKIEVDVPVGSGTSVDATVNVQPSAIANVKFLIITSSLYSDTLTYTVKDGTGTGATTGAADVKLDAAQLLVGGGAIGLLITDPIVFEIKNRAASDAHVQFLVGRDAT